MKIGQLESKAITPAVSERRAQGNGSGASVEASAKVELSPAAAQLAGSGGTEGVFDPEKVQRISEAIREGRYKVNAEAIADKLITNAQEMLGKPGKA